MLSRRVCATAKSGGPRLDDIDWQVGEVPIRGKGGRQEPMPLPVDVSQAPVEYYPTDGWPTLGGCGRVLLIIRAPFNGLTMTPAMPGQRIYDQVRRAATGLFAAFYAAETP